MISAGSRSDLVLNRTPLFFMVLDWKALEEFHDFLSLAAFLVLFCCDEKKPHVSP